MTSIQRLALWVIMLSLLFWGVGLLVVPGFLWETLGGAEPVSSTYSRYAGAWFLAVTVAAWAGLQGTSAFRPVLLISFIGAAISFAVILIDLVAGDDPTTNDWILWLADADAAALAILSWLALREPIEAPAG